MALPQATPELSMTLLSGTFLVRNGSHAYFAYDLAMILSCFTKANGKKL